eukprot:745604-Hanusia_phi.AAC.2
MAVRIFIPDIGAQPRNVLCGHVIAAIISICLVNNFSFRNFLRSLLLVSLLLMPFLHFLFSLSLPLISSCHCALLLLPPLPSSLPAHSPSQDYLCNPKYLNVIPQWVVAPLAPALAIGLQAKVLNVARRGGEGRRGDEKRRGGEEKRRGGEERRG